MLVIRLPSCVVNPRRRELAHLEPALTWLSSTEAALAYQSAERFDCKTRYGLDPNSVCNVEVWQLTDDLAADTRWLRRRISEPVGSVIVVFGRAEVARMHVRSFLEHWSVMFMPARDDAIILPERGGWGLVYCHEEFFEYGKTP